VDFRSTAIPFENLQRNSHERTSNNIFAFFSAAALAGLALMMAFAIMVYSDSSPGATPEELASVLALP
jgi:hypothetical protein